MRRWRWWRTSSRSESAWAREHRRARLRAALARVAPGAYGSRARRFALQAVLRAQVETIDPDVVYLQDMGYHSTAEVVALKAGGRRSVAGQIASPAPPERHLRAFDLIVSSFPHFAKRFRELGLDSETCRSRTTHAYTTFSGRRGSTPLPSLSGRTP